MIVREVRTELEDPDLEAQERGDGRDLALSENAVVARHDLGRVRFLSGPRMIELDYGYLDRILR